jgi:hypothetical protein
MKSKPPKRRKVGKKDFWNTHPSWGRRTHLDSYPLDFAIPEFEEKFEEDQKARGNFDIGEGFFSKSAAKKLRLKGAHTVGMQLPEYSRKGGVQVRITHYFPPESAKKLGLLKKWNGTRWNMSKPQTNKEFIESCRASNAAWKTWSKERQKEWKTMTVEITGNKIKYISKKKPKK